MNLSHLKSFRLIKPYIKENALTIAFGLLSLLVVDLLQLVVPRIIKLAIDDLTLRTIHSSQLLWYAAYVTGIAAAMGVLRYFWRHCLIGTSRRVEEGLLNQLFGHIQRLSAGYFDRVPPGDLMARASNDLQNIRMAVGMGLVALTDTVVLGVAAIGFMLYINVTLTCFALLPMPLIAILARVMTKRMHRMYKVVQASFGDLTETIREKFAGIRIIKAYTRHRIAADQVANISRNYVRENMRLIRLEQLFYPSIIFFSNLSSALVIYLGGRQAINLAITPGDFVAFVSYLGLVTWPMMAIGWVMNLLQRGAASLDRINAVLSEEPEIASPRQPVKIETIAGAIAFEKVGFKYAPEKPFALSNVSFSIRAGEVLGVVGPTGGGKTTLCNLLLRRYDPTSGRVLIDTIDVRTMELQILRSHLAVVPQEAFLFSGSIRDNLRIGNEVASENEMADALKAASLYETVASFPGQLDAFLGEKGVTLSGGQRQRLTLARALLTPARILVLDDALSQVDARTAAEILTNIKKLWAGRTLVMVSHRISHIKEADLIIVIGNGRIIQTGVHNELASQAGIYAKMYRWQEIEDKIEDGLNRAN